MGIESIARVVLYAHLLLVPLAFARVTVEAFEFIKLLLLVTTTLALLSLRAFALPRSLSHELRQPLVLAGGLFVMSAGVSTATSCSPYASLYGQHGQFAGLLTFTCLFVLFLSSRWLIDTPQRIQQLLTVVTISTIVIVIYGVVQTLNLDPFTWTGYSTVGDTRRPSSTLGHPNALGAYLVLALPLVVWRWRQQRALCAILAVGIALLIVLTLSRSAWLGLAASAIVALFFARPRWSRAALLLLPIVAALAVPAVRDRLTHFLDDAGRWAIWSAGWQMFLERPLVGWGPDTFGQTFGQFARPDYWLPNDGTTPARAHNPLIQVLATQGLLGACAMIYGVWAIVRSPLSPPLAASLAGFAIAQLFGFMSLGSASLAVVLLGIVSRQNERAIVMATPRAAVRWPGVPVAIACAYLFSILVIDSLRASIASREGRHDEAVQLSPREAIYWQRLAWHAEERMNADGHDDTETLERMLIGYGEALKRHPHDAFFAGGKARALAGLARLRRAEPADAYTAFDRAIALDPVNPYNFIDASRAALRLADARQADGYITAGLQQHGYFGPMREQRAMHFLLVGQIDEAQAAFEWAYVGKWTFETELVRMDAIKQEVARRVALMRTGVTQR